MKSIPFQILAAVILGLASPFVGGVIDPPAYNSQMSLVQAWFFALPVLVDGWLLPEREYMLGLAATVYSLQYMALFVVFTLPVQLLRRLSHQKAVQLRMHAGSGNSFETAAALYHSRDSW